MSILKIKNGSNEWQVVPALQGEPGAAGPTGPQGPKGDTGQTGEDGITPTIAVTSITGGHNVAFSYGSNDARNTDFDVMDGAIGSQGPKGDKGDKGDTGETGATGPQGPQGQTGATGATGPAGSDGYSPIATVTKANGIATISVTDKNGTTTAQIVDGQDGIDGQSGVYVGDTQPTNPSTQVWIDTSGEQDVIYVTGSNPVINGVSGTRYICGEVSTISITPPSQGIIDVIFTSGSPAAILTLPQTVKMPNNFLVGTYATYEINIMDGIYGAVMAWT